MLYPDFHELIRIGSRRAQLDVASGRNVLAATSGNFSSPFRGQGLTFHEVREYRPGDDIRHIDWRVTARSNKPHMKVFTEDRERTVLLCIDANTTMQFGTRGTFKSVQAARVAAFLGWLANGSHDRVGCLLFGDVPEGMQLFKPARSRRSLWQALKTLCQKSAGPYPGDPVPLAEALKQLNRVTTSGALIFVVSDFAIVTETLEKRLGGLQHRADPILIRIDDPADSVIPAMGLVSFSDGSGQTLTVDTDSEAGRQAYAEQWRQNRNRLEDICTRRGIGMIGLQTTSDIHAELLPRLRRLALGRRA